MAILKACIKLNVGAIPINHLTNGRYPNQERY